MVDGLTLARGRKKGLDAETALADNNSGAFLAASGDLLRCGPTGTNVGDLVVAFHDQSRAAAATKEETSGWRDRQDD